MENLNNERLFTFIEVAMVLAILSTMATVAAPNFKKARILKEAFECVENLKTIEFAKGEWASDTNAQKGAVLPSDLSEIDAYIKGGAPVCPAGGIYTYNPIGFKPECSIGAGVDEKPDTPDDHILSDEQTKASSD